MWFIYIRDPYWEVKSNYFNKIMFLSHRDRIKNSLKESDDGISSVVYRVYRELVYPDYLSNTEKLEALEQTTQKQVLYLGVSPCGETSSPPETGAKYSNTKAKQTN